MQDQGTRVYHLDPQRQRLVARRRLAFMLPLMIVVAVGFQVFYWWLGRDQRPRGMTFETMLWTCAATVVLLVLVMLWSVRRVATSYRLHLGPDWFRIEMNSMTPIEVRRDEVRLVRERTGGLEIHRHKGFAFGISRGLDRYDEVRDALLAWSPASAGPPPSQWTAKAIANLAAVFGLFVFSGLSYVAKTVAVSFALAAVAAASGLWLWWIVREAPMKRKGFLRAYLLLAAVGVLVMNVARWTMFRP